MGAWYDWAHVAQKLPAHLVPPPPLRFSEGRLADHIEVPGGGQIHTILEETMIAQITKTIWKPSHDVTLRAVLGDKVVGGITVRHNGWIEGFQTWDEGKGCGVLLFKEAVKIAIKTGHKPALTASPQGRRLYERLGFVFPPDTKKRHTHGWARYGYLPKKKRADWGKL